MDDNETQRRPQDRQYTWLWMILALVLTGALLVWLTVVSEPTEVTVVEEEAPEEGTMVPAVPIGQFAMDPAQYAGQMVRLSDIEVASRMGTQAMWINLPTGTPYLIKFDTTTLQQAGAIASGDLVTVAGTVHPMTDSVLAAWQETGAIQNEGQLAEARFATSFLEATGARRTGGADGRQQTGATPEADSGR